MKFFTRALAVLCSALLLASCGGGGGNGGAFQPAAATLVVTATPSTVAPLGAANIEVAAKKGDGSAVVDGTVINILLSPSNLANAATSATTVGGRVSFPVTALSTAGSVRVTVSMADPGIANRTATASVDVSIAGPPPVGRMTAVASPATITQNSSSDIVVTFTKPDGTNVADGTVINALASPASIGTIQSTSSTVGGRANFTFRSGTQNGTATIQLSGLDGSGSAVAVTTSVTITVNGAPPATMTAVANPTSITQNATSDIVVTFTKADGTNVADGTVINALASPAAIGAIQPTSITVGGRANFTFRSGTQNGTATIQFSGLDGSTNTTPVTASVTITVSGAPPATMTAVANPTTITRNATSDIVVTFTKADGSNVADGTVINALASPAGIGTIQPTSATIGGRANFTFRSGTQNGTATIQFSGLDGSGSTVAVTTSVTITVNGAPPAATFTAVPTPPTITRNARSDILVTLLRANGDPVADGITINAVLSPASIGRIAGNGTAAASVSNITSGGRANFQFFSANVDGSAQIVFSAVDPEDAGRTLTATATIGVSGQGTARIVVTPTLSTLTQNSTTDVAVVITNRDNQPVADGTTVNLTVTPASIGTIANASGGAQGNQANATTVGGRANFRFNSASVDGTATLTASAADPDNAGVTLTGSASIIVTGAGVPRLSAIAQSTVLPPNLFGIAPFIGSPYLTEIDVTFRRANGQLVSGTTINISVNPVTFGGLSTLDDPTTADINEFTTIIGQGPVNVVAGQATLFFHSFTLPGSATVTITAIDPDTQEVLRTQVVITVAPTAVPLPSSITAITQNPAVYVQGAGGRSNATIIARVNDGAGNPVPNPTAGNDSWNNVAFEINNAAGLGGARLSAIAANGANQSGSRVITRTFNGQATATFESGTVEGTVTITVTADRADNNVSNGIQDAVTTTLSLTVSDGRLYSIVLTSPTPNGLTVNTVPGAGTPTTPTSPNAGPRNAGNNDGTYSLTVSALATDRRGNPVVAGTALRFGVIDAPIFGFPTLGHGMFYLAGGDGDPAESGSLFTAPTGQFATAGGGAGPGDTLLVFGQLVPGNRDLQEARTVATVNTDTSLDIVNTFNPNDDTGASVNNGPVLPYVIGRATEANIGGTSSGTSVQASTNEIGVATVTLNYPVTRLGKAAYIYAQGDRAGTGTRKVTGTAGIALPGARPAAVTASTTSLPGNISANLLVCLRDANNEALQGYYLRFAFHDLGGGSGSVDNVTGTGVTATPTGNDGCLTALVRTSGITGQDTMAGVIFSSGDATIVDVAITTGATAQNVVNVSPSSLGSDGGTVTIHVTDSAGTPLPGLPIQVACTATGTAASLSSTIPTITDANGNSTAIIQALGFSGFGFSGMGSCKFTVGGANASVSVTGVDYCTPAGGSPPGAPPNPACVVPTPITPVLQASPGTTPGGTINLQLTTNTGAAIPNAQISGSCGAGAGINGFIAPTNGAGQTSAMITSSLTVPATCPGAPATSTCTFVTSFGLGTSTAVTVQGPACP